MLKCEGSLLVEDLRNYIWRRSICGLVMFTILWGGFYYYFADVQCTSRPLWVRIPVEHGIRFDITPSPRCFATPGSFVDNSALAIACFLSLYVFVVVCPPAYDYAYGYSRKARFADDPESFRGAFSSIVMAAPFVLLCFLPYSFFCHLHFHPLNV